MIVLIQYISQLKTNEQLEWTCPTGFTIEDVIQTFRHRFPTATLLGITQLTL
jgi:hypothetical protein